MKVYIITKHGSHNYGAMLQAWSLMTVLKDHGVECKILNYRASKPSLIPPNTPLKRIINAIVACLYHKDVEKCYKRFERFMAEEYDMTKEYGRYKELEDTEDKADIYICGSDQIWNPYAVKKEYFLDFVDDKAVKISYAASLGVNDIPLSARDTFNVLLDNIDYISVREYNAKELIENVTGRRDVSVNVDPVFLIDHKEWNKIQSDCEITEPYILCYFIYTPEWLNTLLKDIYKATKKKIVLVTVDPFRRIYSNKIVRDAGPKEFIGLIRGADCVISSSFHGIALSIANGIPFYAIINPKLPARLDNLLNTFDLRNRIIMDSSVPDFAPIDYEKVKKIVLSEREKSLSYLMGIINNPVKPRKAKSNTIETVGIKCTGCGCCELVCPVKAIKMVTNDEGFKYPVIDKSKCVECGICVGKCHAVGSSNYNKSDIEVYYGYNVNAKVRHLSTSGGLFSALADKVISVGGLVAGAYFEAESKSIKHATTDHISLEKLRRSKYAESDLGTSFTEIKKALDEKRTVLFCGTPCQCAGLKNYIGENDNLLICDFFCHGVPSGKVFKDYLNYLESQRNDKIIDYQFRTKEFGWSQYGVRIEYEKTGTVDTVGRCEFQYVSGMLDDLFLRKSCYTCNKSLNHVSDITIGDFWVVFDYDAKLNDEKGLSVVLCNTIKGKQALNKISDTIELNKLEPADIKYALTPKKKAVQIKRRNIMFDEYKKMGCEAFIKKYYLKRLRRSKVIFWLKNNFNNSKNE